MRQNRLHVIDSLVVVVSFLVIHQVPGVVLRDEVLRASGRQRRPYHAIVRHVRGAVVQKRLRGVPQLAAAHPVGGGAVAGFALHLAVITHVDGAFVRPEHVHSEMTW